MVVAGVGVEHQRLVEAVQKYFVDEKPIWATNNNLIISNKDLVVDDSVAQYTGGLVQVSVRILFRCFLMFLGYFYIVGRM